ncbi:MAG: VWA domain-containing protein [Myxococcota bacterium]|nr:VWA domain-containing protein [Myxococcota bacterium]
MRDNFNCFSTAALCLLMMGCTDSINGVFAPLEPKTAEIAEWKNDRSSPKVNRAEGSLRYEALAEMLVHDGVHEETTLTPAPTPAPGAPLPARQARPTSNLSALGRSDRSRGESGPDHVPGARSMGQQGPVSANGGDSKTHFSEAYDRVDEQAFMNPKSDPLSTFSIDVDTASYANARRYLEHMRALPPVDAVRIEEFVNYFDYHYDGPSDGAPFAVHTEVSSAPWNDRHQLVKIGLQGEHIDREGLPPSNLVFLLDVSGSMNRRDKLPLLKEAFGMLINHLRPQDRVAIVVYASASGLVLPSTSGAEKDKIRHAIHRLHAGGGTAGGSGIKLAYRVARHHFVPGGINRVILATDGDFNVGVQTGGALERLIEKERKSGVFLTVLGFGRGNYKDARMERLSNRGNGHAAYIDTLLEAKKVLVTEMGGSLMTIAKDVKIQVEFNPRKVSGYRLIGYENRVMAHRDFSDDEKDAGELGAGHRVTALYELIPANSTVSVPSVRPLRYQQTTLRASTGLADELMTVKLRYKKPAGQTSRLMTHAVPNNFVELAQASEAFRFASAVAEFAMLLRNSKYRGQASYDAVIHRAKGAMGQDMHGYRAEFVQLVRRAQVIDDIRRQGTTYLARP